ncbi:MAG TPA: signal recognition particle-docking protein FtsY [Rectinemataceae bacterium]
MGFADRIKALFRRNALDDAVFEDLADLLVEGDVGAGFAFELVDSLKALCRKEGIRDAEEARRALKRILRPFALGGRLDLDSGGLNVVLLLGVNGVGKTTSCAKLASWAKKSGMGKIILAAGDTFRAAAVNQLVIHGQRLGIRVVAQGQGADAGAVLWDSIEAAGGEGLVVADTAGRMHTRADLMKELEKMDRIVSQKAPSSVYRKILVLDATTGQNGMRQAEIFNDAVKLDGVILSKYDSTAKGGMVLTLGKQLGLKTLFVGTGEGYEDISVFDPEAFLQDFVGGE